MHSFLPRDILVEIWDVIESVSEGFPTYSFNYVLDLGSPWLNFKFCTPSLIGEYWLKFDGNPSRGKGYTECKAQARDLLLWQ